MAAAISFAFTPTPLGAAEKLRVRATPQLSAGIGFVSKSRFKDVFLGAAASASPAIILGAYTGMFGTLVQGTKIFWKVSVINSVGFESVPVETSTITA